jgi:hypothetical protein
VVKTLPCLLFGTVGVLTRSGTRLEEETSESSTRDANSSFSRAEPVHHHVQCIQSDSCRAKGRRPSFYAKTNPSCDAQGSYGILCRVQGACGWRFHELVRLFDCFTSRLKGSLPGTIAVQYEVLGRCG